MIIDLYESVSFVETHRVISKLKDYADWSEKNISDLCSAVIDNNQVQWVIYDKDVYDFFTDLIGTIDSEDEYIVNVKNYLMKK